MALEILAPQQGLVSAPPCPRLHRADGNAVPEPVTSATRRRLCTNRGAEHSAIRGVATLRRTLIAADQDGYYRCPQPILGSLSCQTRRGPEAAWRSNERIQ